MGQPKRCFVCKHPRPRFGCPMAELLHQVKYTDLIGICSIVAVVIVVKILIWIRERNELVKVPVKVEDDDNR